ncbi:hypothetical protein Kyoto69B_05540 [Helicobacter pylori]
MKSFSPLQPTTKPPYKIALFKNYRWSFPPTKNAKKGFSSNPPPTKKRGFKKKEFKEKEFKEKEFKKESSKKKSFKNKKIKPPQKRGFKKKEFKKEKP